MLRKFKWKIILIVLIAAGAVYYAFPPQDKINLGLDLQGGMHVVLEVDKEILAKASGKDALARAIEVIRNRVNEIGGEEVVVQQEGNNRIIVQIPGVTDREKAVSLIGRTALLEFKLVSDNKQHLEQAKAGNVPAGYELKYMDAEDGKKEALLVEVKASLSGESLVDAQVSKDRNGLTAVSFEFDPQGARRFGRLTADNKGKRLAILLDGVVKSAPSIETKITSSGIITQRHGFSYEDAADMALVLRSGALPVPLTIAEERTVGPTLGRDSVEQGIRATLIGAALVVGFMAVYYLLAGLVANFALCFNILLIMGGLSYFKAALTLPGIAGIILTIGMAVDANVLIFERIREELNVGRTLKAAIRAGYQKAFVTIIDANVTTLITALILFYFGTGPVKGFAVTLSIGIIASMFTALVVTRFVFDLLTLNPKFKRLPMLQLIRKPSIDFVGKRKGAYLISLVIIVLGLAGFFSKGEKGFGIKKNFGIDFTTGTIQQLVFNEPVNIDKLRGSLKDIGLGDSLIQQFGDDKEVIIRTYPNVHEDILKKLRTDFGADQFEVLRVEMVGPSVGRELTKNTFIALALALGAICLYISWRFEFRFAVAAIVALVHDCLITIGAFSITGREISLPVVAALLTIIGYSLNDTIVVFDRIREDLKIMKKETFDKVVNISINQTLGRTVLTSLTTLLVVGTIFFFGGEVINDFAFALMIGVVVGTYSSIFVASPILVEWHYRIGKRL